LTSDKKDLEQGELL